MRLHRLIAIATPLVLTAGTAHAQDARLFQNAWFWGVHAGATSVGTARSTTSEIGTVGAEWLITRSMGGLYVSYDQASFRRTAAIRDVSTSSGARSVSINDMRTGSVAALAFPFHAGGFRPYAGLGFALSVLGGATAKPDSAGGSVPGDVAQRTENARSRTAVFVMGGAQYQMRRAAIFGQIEALPGDANFLITRPVTMITAGIRYNFGSSIER